MSQNADRIFDATGRAHVTRIDQRVEGSQDREYESEKVQSDIVSQRWRGLSDKPSLCEGTREYSIDAEYRSGARDEQGHLDHNVERAGVRLTDEQEVQIHEDPAKQGSVRERPGKDSQAYQYLAQDDNDSQ